MESALDIICNIIFIAGKNDRVTFLPCFVLSAFGRDVRRPRAAH